MYSKRNNKTKPQYPRLMATNDIVVLMLADSEGMVVDSNSIINPLGRYCKTWNMDAFEDFAGTVTLSNEEIK